MAYEKPEVAVLGGSLKAIQGVSKSSINQDAQGRTPAHLVSAAAYEADE